MTGRPAPAFPPCANRLARRVRRELHLVARDDLRALHLRQARGAPEVGTRRVGHKNSFLFPHDRVLSQWEDRDSEVAADYLRRISPQAEIKGVAVVEVVDEKPAVENEARDVPNIVDAKNRIRG